MSHARAVSYNVHGCVGMDGVRDVERVAEVIRRQEPDAVGLQEVDGRMGRLQLDALARATGMEAIAGPTVSTLMGDFGNAVLTRHDVIEVRRVDLTFARREPRGLLDVSLRLPAGNLRMLVVHFGLMRRERSAQTEMLLGQLGRSPSPLTIVLGDFNEWWPLARATRRLDQRLGRMPRPRTWPSTLPLLPLDCIWLEPRTALQWIVVAQDELARTASDHLPVVAQFAAVPQPPQPLVPGESDQQFDEVNGAPLAAPRAEDSHGSAQSDAKADR